MGNLELPILFLNLKIKYKLNIKNKIKRNFNKFVKVVHAH
jgi:hypothetical protein